VSNWQGYRVIAFLGAGSMGRVYRLERTTDGAAAALKILVEPAAVEAAPLLLRRQKALIALDHPSLIQVYEVGVLPVGVLERLPGPPVDIPGGTERLPYVLMEYVEGRELGAALAWSTPEERLERLPLLARLIGEVAAGLDHLHRRFYLHRDLKPENVLVRTDGHACLLDYGLLVPAGNEQGEYLSGTLDYLAPEFFQEGRRLDGRADLYALAVMTWELLAGRLPFADQDETVLLQGKPTAQPPALRQFWPGAPRRLEGVLRQALAPDPAARYPTAGQFARALESVLPPPPGKQQQTPSLFAVQEDALQHLNARTPEDGGDGLPHFLLLEGPAEAGKSHVLAAHGENLRHRGHLVVEIVAEPGEESRRRAFTGLLRGLLDGYRTLWRPLPSLFKLCAGVLPRYFPALADREEFLTLAPCPPLQPAAEEHRLGDLLTQLVHTLATHHRLSLLLNNAESLGLLEINLLRYLYRNLSSPSRAWAPGRREMTLAVVATVNTGTRRSEELQRLKEEILRHDPAGVIALEPLTPHDLATLVQAEWSVRGLPWELLNWLGRKAQWRPGTALQLLREAEQAGVVSRKEERLEFHPEALAVLEPDREADTQVDTERLLTPEVRAVLRRLLIIEKPFPETFARDLLADVEAETRQRMVELARQRGWLERREAQHGVVLVVTSRAPRGKLLEDLDEAAQQALYGAVVDLAERPDYADIFSADYRAEILARANRPLPAFDLELALAEAARERLDHDRALSGFTRAASLLEQLAPKERSERAAEILQLYRRLGESYFVRGQREKALEVYRRFGALCPDEAKVEFAVEGLSVAFTCFAEDGDLLTAEAYGWQAVNFAREAGAPRTLARSLMKMASLLSRQGKDEQARGVIQEAVALLSGEDEVPEDLAAALNVLGTLLRKQGSVVEALEHFRQSHDIYAHADDAMKTAMTLQNLGLCRQELGAYEQADTAFDQANALFVTAGYLPGSGLALTGLGNVALERGRLDAAHEYFTRARSLFENLRDRDRTAMALNNLGEVCYWQGRLRDAEEALQRALELRDEQTRRRLFIVANLAGLRCAQGRFAEALRLLQDNLPGDGEEVRLTMLCHLRLMETFHELGRLADAHHCYQLACSVGPQVPDAALHSGLLLDRAWALAEWEHFEEASELLEQVAGRPELKDHRRLALWREAAQLACRWRDRELPLGAGQQLDELERGLGAAGYRLLQMRLLLSFGYRLLATDRPEAAVRCLNKVRVFAQEEEALDFFWLAQAGLSAALSREGQTVPAERLRGEASRMLELLLGTLRDDHERNAFLAHPLRRRAAGFLTMTE
jgi:serine/threonine protein kinase/tetratricopeptide (TPR) repeat protein